MDSFVAIDFETAAWGAACSVGLAHFEDGRKVAERYTLLNPKIPARQWDRGALRVHGIHPRDVVDAPTFEDIWPELVHWAACYPLIAHNANFDIGVIRAELIRANLPAPTIRYGCSLRLAQRAWPRGQEGSPENHRLSTLSEFLSIELDHHNALSDALACGEIAVQATAAMGQNTLAAAFEQPRLSWGELTLEADAD